MKKLVIISMISAITLPFILLTDIYPFYRLSMYAKPLKDLAKIDMYLIRINYGDSLVNFTNFGSQELFKQTYYKKNTGILLKKVYGTLENSKKNKVRSVDFYRIIYSTKKGGLDTTLVDAFYVRR